MDDAYCLRRIEHIRDTIHGETMWVREAMQGALLGIGKRNKKLTISITVTTTAANRSMS